MAEAQLLLKLEGEAGTLVLQAKVVDEFLVGIAHTLTENYPRSCSLQRGTVPCENNKHLNYNGEIQQERTTTFVLINSLGGDEKSCVLLSVGTMVTIFRLQQ